MFVKPFAALSAAAFFCASTSVLAQNAAGKDNGIHGFIVLGAGAVPDYEGSDDHQAIPFIGGRLQAGGRYLAVEGLVARADILGSKAFEAGPVVKLTFGRDADISSDAVSDLGDIDDAVEVGGFLAYSWPSTGLPMAQWRVAAQVVQDVSDVHDGWLGTLSTGYLMSFGPRLAVGIDTSVTAASDNYAETYFSVSEDGSVTSGLNSFDAEGGVKDLGLSVKARFSFSEHWLINGFAGYNRLIGDFADSPIVDDEGDANQFSAGIGIGYRF